MPAQWADNDRAFGALIDTEFDEAWITQAKDSPIPALG